MIQSSSRALFLLWLTACFLNSTRVIVLFNRVKMSMHWWVNGLFYMTRYILYQSVIIVLVPVCLLLPRMHRHSGTFHNEDYIMILNKTYMMECFNIINVTSYKIYQRKGWKQKADDYQSNERRVILTIWKGISSTMTGLSIHLKIDRCDYAAE